MNIFFGMVKNNLSYTVLKEVGFKLLAEGRTIKIRAEGFSMYPAIKPGSVIFIEPFEKGSEPVPGQTIAWKKNSGFVVHRLVRSYNEGNNRYVITRGDSSPAEDDPVSAGQVAGRVVRIEDPEGKIIPFNHFPDKMPNYAFNRFLVKIILQIYRIKRFF